MPAPSVASVALPGAAAPPLSTYVDMTGLALVRSPEEPLLSLENLDTEQAVAPNTILLNSPRSVEACLRLGIRPHELLKLNDAPSEQHLAQHDRRRAEKMRKLLSCRHEIGIEFDSKLHEHAKEQRHATENPLLAKERARIAKVNQVAEFRARTLESIAQARREKHTDRVRRAEDRIAALDEEKNAHRAKQSVAAAGLAESREVFKAARQAIEETRRDAAVARAAQAEQQRARRRWQQELVRQDHELRNAVHAAESRRRQATIRQRQAAEAARRELDAEQRMEVVHRAKLAVDAMKEQQIATAVEKGRVKTERMTRNRLRLQEANRHTLDVQEAALRRAEEYREELAVKRDQETKVRREEAARAAAMRQSAKEQAEQAEIEAAAQLEARALHTEAMHELMAVQRDVALRKKQLAAHVRSEERKDALTRAKRAEEYKRYQLLVKLEEKQRKVEGQQEEARAIVEEHRQEVLRLAAREKARRKAVAVDLTPGPGEYDVDRGVALLSEFEAPRSVNFTMDEKMKEVGDLSIPGPGTYELIDENVRRNARPSHAIPKSVVFRVDPSWVTHVWKMFRASALCEWYHRE